MLHFTPLSYKTQFFQNRWASSNVLCTRWSGSSNVEVWQSILAAGALFSPGALAFVFQHQLSSIFLFHWPRGSCRCHFFSGFLSCVQRLVWSLLTEILLCTQHSHCFTSIKLIIEKCPSGISGRTSFADVDIEAMFTLFSRLILSPMHQTSTLDARQERLWPFFIGCRPLKFVLSDVQAPNGGIVVIWWGMCIHNALRTSPVTGDREEKQIFLG